MPQNCLEGKCRVRLEEREGALSRCCICSICRHVDALECFRCSCLFSAQNSQETGKRLTTFAENGIPGAVEAKFIESGLTSGTSWSVTVGTGSKSSTSSDIIFNVAENTKYSYSVSTVFGTTPSPSSGTFNSGYGVTVDVTYSPAYSVKFAENTSAELPTGTQWSAKLGSSSYSTTGTSMSIGVSDGTFSYSIGRLNQYSPIPASGSVTVNGKSVELEVYFVNNSTTVSSIKRLVNYFNPNWNYSSVDLARFTYTANNVSGYYNDSASGTLVLNNTTYSFTFWQTDLNATTTSSGYSTINLTNGTYVAHNGSNYDESWINTTTLNNTLQKKWENVSQNLDAYWSNDSANRSIYIQHSIEQNNIFNNTTSYDNSSTKHDFSAAYDNLGTGTENVSFNVSDPIITLGGYYLYSGPNENLNVTEGQITGFVMNGSSKENFSIEIKNGNGTLNLQGDPVNFTVDPQVYSKYYWWGVASIYVQKLYFYGEIPSWEMDLLSAEVGALVGLIFAPIPPLAVFLGIWAAFATGQELYFYNSHPSTSGSNTFILYGIGGVSASWLYGIGVYAEIGMYSNQYYLASFNNYLFNFAMYDTALIHQNVWPKAGPPW